LRLRAWGREEKCQMANSDELVGCIGLIGFIG
jgi:hypothetical protein